MKIGSVFCVLSILYSIDCANILFFAPIPSFSHQVIFQPIWKELSLRGHNVTTLAVNILNDKTLVNLTEIDLSILYTFKKELPKDSIKYIFDKPNFLGVFLKDMFIYEILSRVHELAFEIPEVQRLIKGDTLFDAVIVEWLFPTGAAFAAKFNCTLIGVSSFGAPIPALDAIGNPSHPIFAPDHTLPVMRDMSLKERILSTIFSVYARVYYQYVVLPKEDRTVKKFFGDDMPYIGDIERNVSLLLLNRNPVFHKIMPVLPNVQEFGGLMDRETRPQLNSVCCIHSILFVLVCFCVTTFVVFKRMN